MKNKKNPKYDLEKYRSLFFTMALVLVLSVVLIVINIRRTNETKQVVFNLPQGENFIEFTPNLNIGKAKKQKKSEKINIVDDKTELPDSSQTDFDDTAGKTQQQSGNFNDKPLYTAEIMPEYPGGIAALKRDLAKAVELPDELNTKQISGQMFIQFVVNKQGLINEIKILKSIHKQLDDEVIKALQNLKTFKPASQNGNPVSVYFILPISFKF